MSAWARRPSILCVPDTCRLFLPPNTGCALEATEATLLRPHTGKQRDSLGIHTPPPIQRSVLRSVVFLRLVARKEKSGGWPVIFFMSFFFPSFDKDRPATAWSVCPPFRVHDANSQQKLKSIVKYEYFDFKSNTTDNIVRTTTSFACVDHKLSIHPFIILIIFVSIFILSCISIH